jgi:hypothetical protein
MPSSPAKPLRTSPPSLPSPSATRAWQTAANLPPRSDPLAPALLRAENAGASLHLVARHHGRLVAELAPILSPHHLEHEVALALVAIAREAAGLKRRDGEEPPDGDDLFTRVIRGAMARLQAAEDEETDRKLAAQLD